MAVAARAAQLAAACIAWAPAAGPQRPPQLLGQHARADASGSPTPPVATAHSSTRTIVQPPCTSLCVDGCPLRPPVHRPSGRLRINPPTRPEGHQSPARSSQLAGEMEMELVPHDDIRASMMTTDLTPRPAGRTTTASTNPILDDAHGYLQRGTPRQAAAAVISQWRTRALRANIPVERLHGFVDAIFPIVATVLFAKNFSEIEESEAEDMKETCTDEPEHCSWWAVAKFMWVGRYGTEQLSRLVGTLIVFTTVYIDWAGNVRIFRGVERVSKSVMLTQMAWCIGETLCPLTLSPVAMGFCECTPRCALMLGLLLLCCVSIAACLAVHQPYTYTWCCAQTCRLPPTSRSGS
jgi:uncharacterized membrane protein